MPLPDNEAIIGQMILLLDVVEGSAYDPNGNVTERYMTTRFRHASLAKADGPDRHPDLPDELRSELNEYGGDIDPDGAVTQAVNFIYDYENGTL